MNTFDIDANERQKGYGSILLQKVFAVLQDEQYRKLRWHVYPIFLRNHESLEAMFPKLIDFYKQHGAQLDEPEDDKIMMYYLFHKNRLCRPWNVIPSRL